MLVVAENPRGSLDCRQWIAQLVSDSRKKLNVVVCVRCCFHGVTVSLRNDSETTSTGLPALRFVV